MFNMLCCDATVSFPRFSNDVHLKPILDRRVQILIGNDGVDPAFAHV